MNQKKVLIPDFIQKTMKHDVLDSEELLGLIDEYKKTGDISLRDKVILANQKLILSVSRKYINVSHVLEIEDFINAGNVGFVRAIEKFDPKINPNFLAYATFWIKSEVLKLLFDNYRQFKIPRNVVFDLLKYNKTLKVLGMSSQDVSPEKVLKETGLSQKDIEDLRVIGQNQISLDQPLSDGHNNETGNFLHESIKDERKTPEESFLLKFQTNKIRDLLDVLTDREKEILMLRYGCVDGKFHILEFVGEKFGVTRERIRQIEKEALKKIKRSIKNNDRECLASNSCQTNRKRKECVVPEQSTHFPTNCVVNLHSQSPV